MFCVPKSNFNARLEVNNGDLSALAVLCFVWTKVGQILLSNQKRLCVCHDYFSMFSLALHWTVVCALSSTHFIKYQLFATIGIGINYNHLHCLKLIYTLYTYIALFQDLFQHLHGTPCKAKVGFINTSYFLIHTHIHTPIGDGFDARCCLNPLGAIGWRRI